MPTIKCTQDGDPGFKFGESGKCFTYTQGDDAGRDKAKASADEQGKAIESSKS